MIKLDGSLDTVAIEARVANAYMNWRGGEEALAAAMGDVKSLLAEVAMLRRDLAARHARIDASQHGAS